MCSQQTNKIPSLSAGPHSNSARLPTGAGVLSNTDTKQHCFKSLLEKKNKKPAASMVNIRLVEVSRYLFKSCGRGYSTK